MRFPSRGRSPLRQVKRRTFNVQLPYDPFSYARRASERVSLRGVAGDVSLGGEETVRVFVRQANFEKIAHKVDRMGDYKPEIVYEDAGIAEVDPRDDEAVARLNAQPNPQLVTVRDEVG